MKYHTTKTGYAFHRKILRTSCCWLTTTRPPVTSDIRNRFLVWKIITGRIWDPMSTTIVEGVLIVSRTRTVERSHLKFPKHCSCQQGGGAQLPWILWPIYQRRRLVLTVLQHLKTGSPKRFTLFLQKKQTQQRTSLSVSSSISSDYTGPQILWYCIRTINWPPSSGRIWWSVGEHSWRCRLV